MTATPAPRDQRELLDLLAKAIQFEKDERLAELPRASEPRLSVIREDLAACDSLLSRLAKTRAA